MRTSSVSGIGNLRCAHDSDNRLVAAARGAVSVAYGYDAGGRRVHAAATPGGVNTTTLWSGDMEIADYSGARVLLRRYAPGLGVDARIAMISCGAGAGVCPSAAVHYYVANRIGNVIAMVDAAGAVTDRYVYTPRRPAPDLIRGGWKSRWPPRAIRSAIPGGATTPRPGSITTAPAITIPTSGASSRPIPSVTPTR